MSTTETEKEEIIEGYTPREIAVFAPLILIVFVMGLYPIPFLDAMHASVENLVDRYNSAIAAHEAVAVVVK